VHEPGHVFGVNIIPDLFLLVTEHFVLAALEVALYQITQEAVQLHAGVIRSGETPAAEATGGHA
jgi:hypothetical protein